MKKIIYTLLILLLSSLTITAIDNPKVVGNAEEAFKKGYITAADLEVFKKEWAVEIMTVPYGDFHILNAYHLNVLGLFGDTKDGYRLGEDLTRADAITILVRAIGKTEAAESGKYSAPYNDLPEDIAGYVGYVYSKKFLPESYMTAKTFGPEEKMTYHEYAEMLLNVLGYKKGTDYEADKISRFSSTHGFEPETNNSPKILRAKAVTMAYQLINRSPKGTLELYRDRMVKDKLVSQKKIDFINAKNYDRYCSNEQDEITKAMFFNSVNYDFISYSDCRNGPCGLHPSIAWPDKGITLEWVGDMRLVYRDNDEKSIDAVAEDILRELVPDKRRADYAVKQFREKGEYMHVDYYTRAIELKKRKNFVNIDFYLYDELRSTDKKNGKK